MINNRKGLSAIVVTLIIILLVFVAIGIVWVVVKDILEGGAEDIEISAKCLNVNIKATAVVCEDTDADGDMDCDVTFERTGSNTDVIGGVKLVFRNETSNSVVIDEPGNIEALAGEIVLDIDTTLANPDSIEVTIYFEDASGNEKPCSQTTTKEFTI